MDISISNVRAGDFEFRCRIAGERGEPVILLHSFPETSCMWNELLPRLVAAGYRCVAPDQRGYSPGARPTEVAAYDTIMLAGDVLALATAFAFAFAFERFHLIGHDWGAAVGWVLLREQPARVASWAALSVPHLASYGEASRNHPEQKEKGAYIDEMVQLGRAEAALTANDYARLRSGAWTLCSSEQREEYLQTFSQPAALTGALNWYRFAFDPSNRDRFFQPFDVHIPSLTIWGNGDHGIGRSTTTLEREYMRGPYRFVELDAGHWLIQERFEDVSREILTHLGAHPL
jgi:pimeloyl-ACP methyl ester carboxylesterase